MKIVIHSIDELRELLTLFTNKDMPKEIPSPPKKTPAKLTEPEHLRQATTTQQVEKSDKQRGRKKGTFPQEWIEMCLLFREDFQTFTIRDVIGASVETHSMDVHRFRDWLNQQPWIEINKTRPKKGSGYFYQIVRNKGNGVKELSPLILGLKAIPVRHASMINNAKASYDKAVSNADERIDSNGHD